MNLSFLNSFLAVASSGSFTSAAQELFVTQPAISQHIQALEEELEVRLFIRKGRGAVLTEEGRILRDSTVELMKTLDDVRIRLQESNELHRGRICIAATEVAVYLLPTVLQEFKNRYPGVEVVLVCASTPKTVRMVADGDADYGIARKIPVPSQSLKSQLIHNERLVLVAPSGHFLAGAPHINPRDLESGTFALRERGTFTREFALAWFKGGHLPKSIIEANNMAALRELALQGCAAFLPEGVVERDIRAGALISLPIKAPKLQMEYHGYSRKKETPNKALSAFLCLLGNPQYGLVSRREPFFEKASNEVQTE